MGKIDYLISLNIKEIDHFKKLAREDHDAKLILEELKQIGNALGCLKLITELDPEKNDADTYRDAARMILYNGGWLS